MSQAWHSPSSSRHESFRAGFLTKDLPIYAPPVPARAILAAGATTFQLTDGQVRSSGRWRRAFAFAMSPGDRGLSQS